MLVLLGNAFVSGAKRTQWRLSLSVRFAPLGSVCIILSRKCQTSQDSWTPELAWDGIFFLAFRVDLCLFMGGGGSDIPGQFGSPAVLLGVFSQLPGSFLIGVSHFSDSG